MCRCRVPCIRTHPRCRPQQPSAAEGKCWGGQVHRVHTCTHIVSTPRCTVGAATSYPRLYTYINTMARSAARRSTPGKGPGWPFRGHVRGSRIGRVVPVHGVSLGTDEPHRPDRGCNLPEYVPCGEERRQRRSAGLEAPRRQLHHSLGALPLR